jgi:hypothetical protein
MSATNVPHRDSSSGTRLLRSDLGVALLLLNQARANVIEHVFGDVSDRDSLILTLVAIGVVGQALHDKAPPIRKPSQPSLPGTILGLAAADEAAHLVGGDWSRNAPFFTGLVAFALIAKYHPAFRGAQASIHGVKASARRVRTSMKARYGR